ncbi:MULTISPECIES: CBS domain-containing protein [Photobacterium]|uniref:Acetoin utilization protein AcuB n=1 Tax=Photobacterium ganghwense TaxID=320778 RepID=A0A0J1H7N4_9GAMM|nr:MULTISPECIES: CBS domain-containing protein [Photobacterium]KLV07714.1 acetoin utilization protein AcuB [Photobacterium ganghwense]MBV1842885.1 CBS domain-containing protein [Photobacterium ganghwense]PSU11433.1 CBS domain-containing protein [Photobacterium ganghwense]QSV13540.1 CBS domain-containing protein [Photobacterium ganghwense]
MFTVADMMTPNPHTLSTSHTLADAKRVMAKYHIHHVPVTDENNHLVGLVSQRDILAAQESSLEHISQSRFVSALDIPLADSMHRDLMSVAPNAGLKEAALFMQKHQIGCLPIIDHNKLVGIITDSDFVSIAINLLEIQEEVEPLEEEGEEDGSDSLL